MTAQWPCSLGGEEAGWAQPRQEEALDPTRHAGLARSLAPAAHSSQPAPTPCLPPDLQGAQPSPGSAPRPPGGDAPCPFPQTHTHPGRAGTLQGSRRGSVCSLGEEGSSCLPVLPRGCQARPGAASWGPEGRVIQVPKGVPSTCSGGLSRCWRARSALPALGLPWPRVPGKSQRAPYPHTKPLPPQSPQGALGPPSVTLPRAGPSPTTGATPSPAGARLPTS